MDGKEDRGQQDGEGEREGEAHCDEQDDDQKAGDAESDATHGSDPGRAVTTIFADIMIATGVTHLILNMG
jgi:hypothetical protein